MKRVSTIIFFLVSVLLVTSCVTTSGELAPVTTGRTLAPVATSRELAANEQLPRPNHIWVYARQRHLRPMPPCKLKSAEKLPAV